MKEDSVLLTPLGNRIHMHARDGIRSVRIDRLVSENEMTFAHYPALSLAIIDEASLVLWREELYTYMQPETPDLATVDRTFAIWESLTIAIDRNGKSTQVEAVDFAVRLYYTLNPEG